jgi:HPt (histidine-containing phosphotransfer) domain-containing protein
VTGADPMAPLRARFLTRAEAEVEAMEQALADGDQGTLEKLVHGLAGSAGLFGFKGISEAAVRIDTVYANGETPDADQVRDLIVQVRAAYS